MCQRIISAKIPTEQIMYINPLKLAVLPIAGLIASAALSRPKHSNSHVS